MHISPDLVVELGVEDLDEAVISIDELREKRSSFRILGDHR